MLLGMSLDPRFVPAAFKQDEAEVIKTGFEWRSYSLGGVWIMRAVNCDDRALDVCC